MSTTRPSLVSQQSFLRTLWARWRSVVRVATRQLGGMRGSAILVVALIALPITALTGGLAFYESHVPTPEQEAAMTLGHTDARITVIGGPNPTRKQSMPRGEGWIATADDTGPEPTTPPALPTSASVTATRSTWPVFTTPSGAAGIATVIGPMWGPDFAGMMSLTAGRAPAEADEVLASAEALTHLGATVGDTIETTTAPAVTVKVVGVVATSATDWGPELLLAPTDSPLATDAVLPTWYVTGWHPTVAEITDLNRAGYGVLSRDLLLAPPNWDGPGDDDSARVSAYLLGLVAGGFIALLVGLIAAAALSVGARRQQRALAVTASIGARRQDLFAIVLTQGVVLGAAGAIIGVALGAGLAALALLVTDRGRPSGFWGNYGYHLPLLPLLAIATLAILVSLAAAVAPAVQATRGDTLAALRGARRPASLTPRVSRAGLILLAIGVLCSVAGLIVVVRTAPWQAIVWILVALALSSVGPVVTVIGFALCGRGLLALLARRLTAAPIAVRIAVRDAAANPARSLPAILAVIGAMTVATFALGISGGTTGSATRFYQYQAPLNSLTITGWWADDNAHRTMMRDARSLAASVSDATPTTVTVSRGIEYDAAGEIRDPHAVTVSSGTWASYCDLPGCIDGWTSDSVELLIASADALATITGVDLSPSERRAYADGSAVALRPEAAHDGRTLLFRSTAAELYDGPSAARDRSDVIEMPALATKQAAGPYSVAIAPTTAQQWNIDTIDTGLVVPLPGPLDTAVSDRLTLDASKLSQGTSSSVSAFQELGPESGVRWLLMISALAVAVVVGTSAVALGLSRFERREDDATLFAVGADPRLRRDVNGAQALLLVGIGSLIGAAVALLPLAAAIRTSSDSVRLQDVPVWWVLGLVLTLPLLMSVIGWLIPPRHLDSSRRRAIG